MLKKRRMDEDSLIQNYTSLHTYEKRAKQSRVRGGARGN